MSLSTTSASSSERPSASMKDMDSIRERRLRLQNIIRAMRPPTLTSNPSSLISRNPRRLWDKTRLSCFSSSSSTPDPQAPRHHRASNFRPSNQHLPDIMKREGSSQSTPEASRQPTPFSRRPYETRKSRQLMSEDDRSDEDADYTQETLEEIVRGIKSNSKRRRLDNTIRARKLLSIEANPPIKEFLKAGILRPLIPHVQQREDSTLQLEATWALTNLASGTAAHTAAVVDGGAVPVLIEALAGGDEKVAEQAAWALGNITGEELYRNQVVSAGVVTPLLAALHHGRASSATSTSTSSSSSSSSSWSSPVSLVRVVVWVLANIFRHKGLVMEQQERQACIAALKTLLTHTNSEVTVDALWAVSYIAAEDEEGQRELVAADILPDLVTHLGAKEHQKVIPALRATGNLVMGSDDQTDAVLAAGVLPHYNRLLVSPHHNLRREVSWALSNITAGTRSQIQQVIDGGLLPHLVEIIGQNYLDVQREAAWALSNLTTGGSPEQLGQLLLAGGVSALTSVLAVSEITTVGVALSSLQKILKTPDLREEAVRQVRVAQGVQRLEALQGFVDSDIKERATEILDMYFQGNTEGGDERT
ncbi:importin subunit alpha-3-like [Portunus trituberculatus]|uniref:importin subunit alpha-3-like n=1 Tax=Portunus trituberculatus TaxID=210409 RepID=UPI001E1CD0E4|nr:importin subunit alpha-3-like [Portunus trituberculatus]XP_045120993.1 importin subunit alpha-3-like [Portunus trituberculatus]XP_045120994.1 importin subunit alpha-3-like [Portunus trituberculatus]XP_045120995.1 importin subunit alpha-3-like [Portunus trituberculatus]XP_045120996.1 importin subunit alpha-3-like [Portunus trituberculatus]XP_045120997.1 importin subunit alpha-3-like [Portunus trituberculatus]